MPRLVIISNRLPITVNRKQGELIYYPSAGGLATGLRSLDESLDKVWIGWPGKAFPDEWEQASIRKDLDKDGLVPVFLTDEDIHLYYEGFSNKVIWPHFHYFTQYTTYQDDYWEAYQRVNEKFAEVVRDVVREDDFVWVHDYQLMLLPEMIRQSFPQISIGFFLHIPFPSYEIFRMLPWRQQILEGVLGADQIGFHTFGYMRHFLSAAYRIMGYEHHFGKLTVGNRMVNVDVFPMGIDYDKYAFPEVEEDENESIQRIREMTHDRKLVISIDRLDYTKGIPDRIKAFARFLDEHPEYNRKVSLVMIVVPSRSNVDQYQELKQSVDTLVGEINGKHGTFDWVPIQYFYRSLNFAELTTLYKVADIAMITPLRDGMNLVAKEYVAAKEKSKEGVLILSEMAGAANELNSALLVNPQDTKELVAALQQALEMSPEEQRSRLERMQERLKKYTVKNWAETFMNEQIRLMEERKGENTNLLTDQDMNTMIDDFKKANRRLVILDYDGTLMDFHPDPTAVKPDEELIRLLTQISAQEPTQLVVNSGRDRSTLDEWLGALKGIDFAAEHGVWVKRKKDWESAQGIVNAWKKDIRPVLDNLVERTPGSFVEEKDYSLAWHYRQTDKDLGEKRVREFRDVLLYLTANLDLQVLEGNKVVEIKNAGVNKGKAMVHWLEDDFDFILAIGDDHTDEDTFKSMPEHAYTVKVGMAKTVARYQLVSVEHVRQLLRQLAEVK